MKAKNCFLTFVGACLFSPAQVKASFFGKVNKIAHGLGQTLYSAHFGVNLDQSGAIGIATQAADDLIVVSDHTTFKARQVVKNRPLSLTDPYHRRECEIDVSSTNNGWYKVNFEMVHTTKGWVVDMPTLSFQVIKLGAGEEYVIDTIEAPIPTDFSRARDPYPFIGDGSAEDQYNEGMRKLQEWRDKEQKKNDDWTDAKADRVENEAETRSLEASDRMLRRIYERKQTRDDEIDAEYDKLTDKLQKQRDEREARERQINASMANQSTLARTSQAIQRHDPEQLVVSPEIDAFNLAFDKRWDERVAEAKSCNDELKNLPLEQKDNRKIVDPQAERKD